MIGLGVVAAARTVVGGGGGSIDPLFSNVSLLLHMNGANGGTTFLDSSPSPKTVTRGGNAQTSTAQSQFNGSSGLFDGTGDYLSVPNSTEVNLTTGDWTIEFFFRATTNSSPTLVRKGTGFFPVGIFYSGASINTVCYNTSNSIVAHLSGVASIVTNVWYHVAVTRSGSTFRTFINGVLDVSATSADALNVNSDAFMVASDPSSTVYGLIGHMAEFRLTKGVARYTADFTPPVAPYPNA